MEYLSTLSPWPIIWVCIFVLLDIIVGLCKAFATGTYDSSKMRAGLWHKTGVLAVTVLAYALEACSGFLDFAALGIEGFTVPVSPVVAAYVVLMETGSIIESIGVINPELRGTKLLRLFGQKAEPSADVTTIMEPVDDGTDD